MRIISGKYKGRKLANFEGESIRPTSDRAKEAIFSCLQFDIIGKSFYDGFCGSGAMGIEAISRGASRVVFTDVASKSCKLTQKNLATIGEKSPVINSDCISYLKSTSEKFDIIFLDPPYSSSDGIKALNIIAKRDILNEGGIAILESGNQVNEVIDGLIAYKRKKYGISEFSFYKKANLTTCVFAGSFDPVTKGHVEIVKKALEKFDKVIVALGVNENKTYAFDKFLKLRMLNLAFENMSRVEVVSFDGLLVDFLREKSIVNNVRGIRDDKDLKYEEQMYEINKQNYPEIVNFYLQAEDEMKGVSSTYIKEQISIGNSVAHLLPDGVCEIVTQHFKKK